MSVDTQSQSVWKKFGAGTLIVAKLGKLADQEEEKRFMKASSFKRQQHVVKQPMEAKIPKASEKIVLNSHWSDEHYLKSLSPEAVMLGSQRFVSKPDMRTKAEKEVANDIMHKKMLEAFAIMTNNDRMFEAASFKERQHVDKQPMEAKIPEASEIVLNSHRSDEHYLKSLSSEAVMPGSQRFVSKPDMRTKAEKEVANDIMHKKMLEAFAIMTNNDRMFKACIQNLSSESDRYWSDDEGFDDDCLDDEADRREREYEEDLARSFRNMAEADRREREEGQAYCFRYMAKADS
jgi:hypothetical protein